MGTDREPLAESARFSADWLTLREDADAAARDVTRGAVRELIARRRPSTVVDLGCGTGSGGRWLSPLLSGDERWVLVDHDPDLLTRAEESLRTGGTRGEIRTRRADVSELDQILAETKTAPDDAPGTVAGRARRNAGETLVIASALLDVLSAEQIRAVVAAASRHGAHMLVALSVTGGMRLAPPDPQDQVVREAFNRHQLRGGRRGPQAAEILLAEAASHGLPARCWNTPWRLDAAQGALVDQLIRERSGAAEDQLRGESGAAAADLSRWRAQRLDQSAQGMLHLQIDHVDIMVGTAESAAAP